MSKINVELDTKTHELSVIVDGKSIDNVTNVGIYKYCDCMHDDEERISINISQRLDPEEKGDLSTYIMLSASEGSDLVSEKTEKTDVQRSIANMLKTCRGRK